jgi:hypothetical protein
MSITIRDLRYLLETMLQCERNDAGDHIRYTLKVNGRVVARTKYSHSWRGSMQISDAMISLIAKQMQCSSRTWKMLLLGQASKETYFRELLQNRHISKEEFDTLCGKGSDPKAR